MTPKLTIISDIKGIEALRKYLADKDFVAYDTETTGITRDSRVIGMSVCASEDEAFYVILKSWHLGKLENTEANTMYIKDLLRDLTTKKLIMHNAVFDCIMTQNEFGVDLMPAVHTDTLILAHLLDENRWNGLKELAKAFFGEDSTIEQKEMKESILKNGGKMTRDCYELYKADAQLIAKYGAKDAWLTHQLFYELVPPLFDQGLDTFFYDEESMPLLRGPTYQLNKTGLKIDTTALETLKKTLQVECAEARDFIYKEIHERIKEKYPGTNKKNTFNIGSSNQLAWLLFGEYKLEFGTLTPVGKAVCSALDMRLPYTPQAKRNFISMVEVSKGTPHAPEGWVNGRKVKAKLIKEPWSYIKCDKATLAKHSHRYKWIEKLLEYQRKTKILNTYVTGLEKRLQYGIIYPSFLQYGTTSGRYSSRDPNFQNLPRDDKRVKSCIVARPGKTFVGADYSQLEPRIFAYQSNDVRLLNAFKEKSDFYSVVGMETFELDDCTPQKEGSDAFGTKYPWHRKAAKEIVLAFTYGATPWQISSKIGKTVDETTEIKNAYFEKFADVKKFQLESHELAKKHGYVTNIFGRPRRIPEAKKFNKLYGDVPHEDLPYEARNVLNLAVNHRVQSTAASIVNRAAILFDQLVTQAGINCAIVVQVHDSLVIECAEGDAQKVAQILQYAMEEAVDLKTILLEAEPKIGQTLAVV